MEFNMLQKTRSTLTIDAVAQAAAEGAASVLSRTGKIQAIAALAGLVLRLFRSKESGPERKNQAPAKARPKHGQSSAKPQCKVAPASALEKGGTGHGQG